MNSVIDEIHDILVQCTLEICTISSLVVRRNTPYAPFGEVLSIWEGSSLISHCLDDLEVLNHILQFIHICISHWPFNHISCQSQWHRLYSSIFLRSSFNWSNYRRIRFVVHLMTLGVTPTCLFYHDPVEMSPFSVSIRGPRFPLSHAHNDFKNNNTLLVSNTDRQVLIVERIVVQTLEA